MSPTADVHDFDFLEGEWNVHNRRLRERDRGTDDWDEFEAYSTCRLHLGGVVNVDEIDFPTRGFTGFTMRTFDLARAEWSIYWVNSTRGTLDPPVVGGFDGDRGLFIGDDVDGDRPIRATFQWTKQSPDRCRWEQSFSYDGGATWEVNWTMQLTRA